MIVLADKAVPMFPEALSRDRYFFQLPDLPGGLRPLRGKGDADGS
ncbi:hypothetical protein [Streptomyces brasiliensis]|uniref:Uncharacterized protein n=1 Tax=Streptomyces brasiliensis TaxID=1954 RepID=A0A917L5Z7_9ACTN|nr:hypothetical protein [Streptomyces brasiliensis]GGJ42220.1 hypothetical protein GCM10010121_061620 [Streptomyces brasiliensis]